MVTVNIVYRIFTISSKKESQMAENKEKWFEIVFASKEWYKCYVQAKNASEARYKFVTSQYVRGTEDHEYDASKKHVDTVHIESCEQVEKPEKPKRYKDYEEYLKERKQ